MQLPPNPYKHFEGKTSRLNVDIPDSDYLFLKSISPSHGTLQHITSLYIYAIVTKLRELNITTFSPENVGTFNRIVIGLTSIKPLGLDGLSDDPRAKVGIHQTLANSANVTPDLPSTVNKRKQNRRKTGK